MVLDSDANIKVRNGVITWKQKSPLWFSNVSQFSHFNFLCLPLVPRVINEDEEEDQAVWTGAAGAWKFSFQMILTSSSQTIPGEILIRNCLTPRDFGWVVEVLSNYHPAHHPHIPLVS